MNGKTAIAYHSAGDRIANSVHRYSSLAVSYVIQTAKEIVEEGMKEGMKETVGKSLKKIVGGSLKKIVEKSLKKNADSALVQEIESDGPAVPSTNARLPIPAAHQQKHSVVQTVATAAASPERSTRFLLAVFHPAPAPDFAC